MARHRHFIGLFALLPLAGPNSAQGQLINIESGKQLFFDDYIVAKIENANRRLNPAVKVEANPVVRSDRPWEGPEVTLVTAFFDERLQKFRIRYETRELVAKGSDPSKIEILEPPELECEAFSNDGIHWEKPNLGLVEFKGSKANNILPRACTVEYYVQDLHEKDPRKRYKGFVRTGERWLPNMTFDLYYSPDAYEWTPCPGNPVIKLGRHVGRWGPTEFMGWDPIRKVYAVHMEYSLHMTEHAPGTPESERKRSIGRAESPDMIHWTEPELIVVPDSRDYADIEFYEMPVMAYSGVYFGLLWNFSTTDTLFHPEAVFSRDGIHYEREYRQPYIKRGDNGSFDSVCVYVITPFVHGNSIYTYYNGVNYRTPEQIWRLGKKAGEAIGLAKADLDSFVSIDAGRIDTGVVLTRPIGFKGRHLYLNIKRASYQWGAGDPEMRVELLDSRFVPISGFSSADSIPITETGLSHPVEWRGNPDLSALQGRPISIRISFKNFKLYSFEFR